MSSIGRRVESEMRRIHSIPNLNQREQALREFLEGEDPMVRETIEDEMRQEREACERAERRRRERQQHRRGR